MKKIISLSLALILFFSTFLSAFADVWVNGYTRKNGTYVEGHYRSDPDGNFNNNWSTKGNVNPYTGEYGTKTHKTERAYRSYTLPVNTYNTYNNYDYSDSMKNCSYGQTLHNGICKTKDQICKYNFGNGAEYNTTIKSCSCKIGYSVYEEYGSKGCRKYNTEKMQGFTFAYGKVNANTNLRKKYGVESKKIRVLQEGEKVLYIYNQYISYGGYNWAIVLTSKGEVGSMILDSIDFEEIYN